MYEAFIDLDELVILCRDKQAKQLIQEAVACYRSGAFRSCIVATWNAVVFDFLHKLRELELLGDQEALQQLEKFEKLSTDQKVRELWQFESSIPELALTKFELISQIEKSDIERLFEDRSRCAHPSMTSLEEPFEATAELARYHLRSAVTHLLQRPPVQGRTARERIFQDIKSEYFPTDIELALKHFQRSPLVRARFTLIKDVVLGLTVSLLTESLPEEERMRQFSALNAISKMYLTEMTAILNDRLSDIIINKVTDDNLDKVVFYLANVTVWDKIDEPCQIKLNLFIEKLNLFVEKKSSRHQRQTLFQPSLDILSNAIRIFFLKEVVTQKLQLPLSDLLSLKKLCKDNLINEVISPLLIEQIPQADLGELIEMRSENNEALNTKIMPYLFEKIKQASLKELISLNYFNDEQLDTLVIKTFQNKINQADLDEIFELRNRIIFDLSWELNDNQATNLNKLLELAGNVASQGLEKISFDELLSLHKEYNDDLIDDLIKEKLRENSQNVVDTFENSCSFIDAADNAKLLFDVADLLTDSQWEQILNSFHENDQILDSRTCAEIFCKLVTQVFNNYNDNLPEYWLSFREKLRQRRSFYKDHLTPLEHLIDFKIASLEKS